MNENQIKTGRDGEPVVHACICWGEPWCTHGPAPEKQALNEILSEMAEEAPDLSAVQPGPGMTVPVTSKKPDRQVEMIPGIMVSQRLIDEAVRLTSSTGQELHDATREVVEEQRRERIQKENAEMRELIDTSKQVVLAMVQRMRDPLKYDEKFVSFDTMPAPLQRVVKAYIEAEEANRNLSEAVASLAKDLQPPVVKPE